MPAPRNPSRQEERDESAVARLARLAEWLDTRFRIPGTDWRVGVDGLVGLIPGIGDTLTAMLALYIVAQARSLGARKATLLTMLGNVALDYLIGAIPLVGDAFDIAWQANAKNLALLLKDLEGRRGTD